MADENMGEHARDSQSAQRTNGQPAGAWVETDPVFAAVYEMEFPLERMGGLIDALIAVAETKVLGDRRKAVAGIAEAMDEQHRSLSRHWKEAETWMQAARNPDA